MILMQGCSFGLKINIWKSAEFGTWYQAALACQESVCKELHWSESRYCRLYSNPGRKLSSAGSSCGSAASLQLVWVHWGREAAMHQFHLSPASACGSLSPLWGDGGAKIYLQAAVSGFGHYITLHCVLPLYIAGKSQAPSHPSHSGSLTKHGWVGRGRSRCRHNRNLAFLIFGTAAGTFCLLLELLRCGSHPDQSLPHSAHPPLCQPPTVAAICAGTDHNWRNPQHVALGIWTLGCPLSWNIVFSFTIT